MQIYSISRYSTTSFKEYFHIWERKCNFVVRMKDDKRFSVVRTKLERYLAAHKMRRTPERFAILEKIFSSGDHFYANTLYEAMELEGYRVSRSTIYDTMQLLVDAGLVRRHQFDNQPAQYERIIPDGSKNHLHLVCSVCGRVREIKEQVIGAGLVGRRYAGFTPMSSVIYVYGICGRCQRRK